MKNTKQKLDSGVFKIKTLITQNSPYRKLFTVFIACEIFSEFSVDVVVGFIFRNIIWTYPIKLKMCNVDLIDGKRNKNVCQFLPVLDFHQITVGITRILIMSFSVFPEKTAVCKKRHQVTSKEIWKEVNSLREAS